MFLTSFTAASRELRSSGNLSKRLDLYGLPVHRLPYDPTLANVLHYFSFIPNFDYTFGQDSPPLTIRGEVKISELSYLEDEKTQ